MNFLSPFFIIGEPILSAEHCEGFGDEAEGHPSRRVQHVHESSTSHPHSCALVRNPICYISMEARKPFGWRSIRLYHAHITALPGK